MKIRMTKSPQFYYHITPKWWKDRVILLPRDSGHPGVWSRDDEPPDARICVSPSVAQCLAAIDICYEKCVYVYRTVRRVLAAHPHGVCDSRLTGERWLLKPTVFIRVGYFNGDVLWKLQPSKCFMPGAETAGEKRKQRKYLGFVRRNLHSIVVGDKKNGSKSWLRAI